jgi:hypothetical protein
MEQGREEDAARLHSKYPGADRGGTWASEFIHGGCEQHEAGYGYQSLDYAESEVRRAEKTDL